jgi:RNA polymerase sigma-70 factor (ECF subfamily)
MTKPLAKLHGQHEAAASDARESAARVRDGDEAAFEVLFRAHYAGIRAFVGRYVDEGMVDEVVQEMFFRVWENRATFAVRGSPKAYLYTAARNGALLVVRRGRVERNWAMEVARADPPLGEPADHAVRRADAVAAIAQAIETLPPRCRVVFDMSRRDGLSPAEVAAALGVSKKSVEQHLWRALAMLRKRLAPLFPALVLITRVSVTLMRMRQTS